MQEQTDLEGLNQAALEIRGGAVSAMNAAARRLLPGLAPGQVPPGSLALSLEQEPLAGSFQADGQSFFFTRAAAGDRQLILLRPAGDSPLTARQLEGFSRQMREQLGGLLTQLDLLSRQLDGDEDAVPHLSGASQSFHKMLRLMNNLELMNLSDGELKRQFLPVTMDLAGLCRDTASQAASMLRVNGFELRYDSDCASLLIPGDPELLRRLLLGLISNAVKAAPNQPVILSLRPWEDRAVVTVSGGGAPEAGLSTLLRQEDGLPAPGDGAGMGLPVARRIAELHGGALLARARDEGGLSFVLSLPTGPLDTHMSLHTPIERDGGISPFLVELADLLPGELFQPDMD